MSKVGSVGFIREDLDEFVDSGCEQDQCSCPCGARERIDKNKASGCKSACSEQGGDDAANRRHEPTDGHRDCTPPRDHSLCFQNPICMADKEARVMESWR